MKTSLRRIPIADYWVPAIVGIISILFCLMLYTFKVDSLVTGFSVEEMISISEANSGQELLKNPTFLPYKISQYMLIKAGLTSVLAFRSINILYAIICVALFYYIMFRWHAHRIALLSTAIFASSAWMLHISRISSPYILFTVGPLLLISTGIFIRKSKKNVVSTLSVIGVASFIIYIPYMIYILVPVFIWKSIVLLKSKHRPSWQMLLGGAVAFIIFISPLIYALLYDENVARNFTGITDMSMFKGVSAFSFEYARGIFMGLRAIEPSYWMRGQALLDAASSVLFLLGILFYFTLFRLRRVKTLLSMLLLGTVIVILSHSIYAVGIIVPFIYMIVGGGITHLLKEWFTVFPRNPIARNIGTIMISILVIMIVFYNLNAYFLAWSLTPDTKAAFTTIRVL